MNDEHGFGVIGTAPHQPARKPAAALAKRARSSCSRTRPVLMHGSRRRLNCICHNALRADLGLTESPRPAHGRELSRGRLCGDRPVHDRVPVAKVTTIAASWTSGRGSVWMCSAAAARRRGRNAGRLRPAHTSPVTARRAGSSKRGALRMLRRQPRRHAFPPETHRTPTATTRPAAVAMRPRDARRKSSSTGRGARARLEHVRTVSTAY